MKAVLFESDTQIRLAEMPDPTVGDRDVLIQVGRCGICASDLHAAQIKDFELPYPFVPGHEVAGRVVEVGRAVDHVQVGGNVAVQPLVACGTCPHCQQGRMNVCRQAQAIGLHRPGGFAEYVVAPAQNVYLSGDLADGVAACAEPLACALHGLSRIGPRPADRVLMYGAGAIGLFFLQLVRNHGAGRTVVVDRHPHRLELARELGAEQVMVADDSQEAALAESTPTGFDCVVDATGVPAVVEAAVNHVAPAGRLLLLGSCPQAASISMRPRLVQSRDLAVVGSFGFSVEFYPALQLLREGRIHAEPIVTHCHPLDAYQEALAQAGSGEVGVKIQIAPG